MRKKFGVPDDKLQFVFEADGTEFDDFGFDELRAVADANHILMVLVNDEQWTAQVEWHLFALICQINLF